MEGLCLLVMKFKQERVRRRANMDIFDMFMCKHKLDWYGSRTRLLCLQETGQPWAHINKVTQSIATQSIAL